MADDEFMRVENLGAARVASPLRRFVSDDAHAAMAGKTGVMIGYLHDAFIHVPIGALAGRAQRIDPEGGLWQAVLAATGQPAQFG